MGHIDIVSARIDERLIHGQIGLAWANEVKTNLILVVNDEMSKDKARQALSKMIIPSRIGLRFLSVENSLKIIPQAAENQHIYIILKNIEDVVTLIKNGIPIKNVNLGNLLNLDPVQSLTESVSINEKDIENLRWLLDNNIKIDLRALPQDEIRYLEEI